jgi:hypothetical protein
VDSAADGQTPGAQGVTELSIVDVEAAINRYSWSHELPKGEVAIDATLSRMAHVYGQMIADHATVLPLAMIDAEVARLFLKWRAAS